MPGGDVSPFFCCALRPHFLNLLAVLFCRFEHLAPLPSGSKIVTETGKRHKIFFFLSNDGEVTRSRAARRVV